MKVRDLLTKEDKKILNQLKSSPVRKKKRKRGQAKINWHELMGSNKRGLRRGKGGAWR